MAEAPRKRKARGRSGAGTAAAGERAGRSGGSAETEAPSGTEARTPRERMRAGYAKAEVRNQEAREALAPLGDGERPTVVTIGAVLAAAIAVSILIGYLGGVKVNGATPKFPTVAAPALIMGVMAWGMWRARYWAVLGFQVILVFLIFSAVYGLLVEAQTLAEFAVTLGLLAVSGALFLYMVKAMARIQMPTPPR